MLLSAANPSLIAAFLALGVVVALVPREVGCISSAVSFYSPAMKIAKAALDYRRRSIPASFQLAACVYDEESLFVELVTTEFAHGKDHIRV